MWLINEYVKLGQGRAVEHVTGWVAGSVEQRGNQSVVR